MKALEFKPYLTAILSESKAQSICEECATTYVLGQKIKTESFQTKLTAKDKQRLSAVYMLSRSFGVDDEENQVIYGSAQVARIFSTLANMPTEEFWMLSLNSRNRVIDKYLVSGGGRAKTIADPCVIFHRAVQCNASNLVFVHNHPSGTPLPSQEDLSLTQSLVSGGKVLAINVLDHIIIAEDKYYSFADEGKL